MRSVRWAFALASFACCLLLAEPSFLKSAPQAAPAKTSSHASKARAKHAKHNVRKDKTRSRADARRARHVSAHDRKARSRKSRHRGDARRAVDDRALWLQRAQESEVMTGIASWYGADAHGGATASGMGYDMYTVTAAHRTLPMGTVVRVTDQQNGKSVMVCVTDRGPYVHGRIIDLSYAAAQKINIERRGVGQVALEVVSDESGTPLQADKACYVRYNAARGDAKVGPFRAFADAVVMHEALRQAHPEAEVVLGEQR